MNIATLLIGGYYIYKLADKLGITDQESDVVNKLAENPKFIDKVVKKLMGTTKVPEEKWQAKYFSYREFLIIFLPIICQVFDSLLDSWYFISLKTSDRIIDVPAWVHVVQGLLLFTCKLLR